MNVDLIIHLLCNKQNIQTESFNQTDFRFVPSINNDDVVTYLTRCLPSDCFIASDIHVLDLKGIRLESTTGAPTVYIRHLGFIPIAVSGGGNVICVDGNSGKVYFADHEVFREDGLDYFDRELRTRCSVEGLSREKALKGLIPLSDSLETFLVQLLNDDLTEMLEKLDEE